MSRHVSPLAARGCPSPQRPLSQLYDRWSPASSFLASVCRQLAVRRRSYGGPKWSATLRLPCVGFPVLVAIQNANVRFALGRGRPAGLARAVFTIRGGVPVFSSSVSPCSSALFSGPQLPEFYIAQGLIARCPSLAYGYVCAENIAQRS